jgi:hypothetical protein
MAQDLEFLDEIDPLRLFLGPAFTATANPLLLDPAMRTDRTKAVGLALARTGAGRDRGGGIGADDYDDEDGDGEDGGGDGACRAQPRRGLAPPGPRSRA